VPSGSGTFNFTVRATDSAGCFGEQAYQLSVGPGGGPSFPNGGAQSIPAVPTLGLLLLGGVLLLAGFVAMRR